MSKVAVYIRVSSHSQNVGGQRSAISGWLERNGVRETDVLWFTDIQTGDNLARPGFDRLQSAIFDGRVGTVVCYKLDRLSRRLLDGIKVLCDWCERGVRVVSVTQELDFSGTVGKMIASVLFAVAEMEQEARRERQAAGIEVAKREGKDRGRKVGTTKASPKRAKRLREQGLSYAEIGRALGVSRMAICRYLKEAEC